MSGPLKGLVFRRSRASGHLTLIVFPRSCALYIFWGGWMGGGWATSYRFDYETELHKAQAYAAAEVRWRTRLTT